MSQFGAALAYLVALLVYLVITAVYAPILMALGVPAQVALTATGIGTLCVIGLVIGRATGMLPPAPVPEES